MWVKPDKLFAIKRGIKNNRMIALDKPFISDFLLKTIKEHNFAIISTPEAQKIVADKTLNWISEEESKRRFKENPNTALYTNSENTIGWIEKNIESSKLLTQIQLFKNKIKFRELVKDSYPNYYFKAVKFKGLRNLDVEKLKFPFIIKPAVGFFSLAVHKVDKPSEWNQVVDKIEKEIESPMDQYPEEVLNTTDFIIEEYIEGEEYAIDCYFDQVGTPVILIILHHVFSSDKDVSDRIYSTSKGIIEKHKKGILGFLEVIGKKADLKNFPLHLEVRINEKGTIAPIEVNPLRYGGLCTTGDLSWYAYGINSYACFLNTKTPDWDEILKTRIGKKYSIIVLDNNSGIPANKIESFDYEQLVKDFEKPLDLRKIDFTEYSLFGILFVETKEENEEELNQILTSNLRKYIKLKKAVVDTP